MTAAVVLSLALLTADPTAPGPAAAAPRTRLLAHYLPWFAAKPHAPAWGWHWTMGRFDPDRPTAGRRPLASHYYPLAGPYDSADPAAVEYHLLLMKLAGFDGLVADWYGTAALHDYPAVHRNTAALFPAAARHGLAVAVCYEDQVVPKLVAAGKLAAAERAGHARAELAWLGAHWFAHPAYLTHAGRPVLLSFGADGLTDAEWAEVLPAGATGPVYLSEHRRRPSAAGGFDWPVPADGAAAQGRFRAAAGDWPVQMPVACPRFHDIYAEAGVRASYGRMPDAAGRTFADSLRAALAGRPAFAQVATWNDWGEGTQVEPSAEFGYRDLEAVQRLRKELVDPAFRFVPADLRLAERVLRLRRAAGDRPGVRAELDRVAGLVAVGLAADARAAVERAEAAAPPGAGK